MFHALVLRALTPEAPQLSCCLHPTTSIIEVDA